MGEAGKRGLPECSEACSFALSFVDCRCWHCLCASLAIRNALPWARRKRPDAINGPRSGVKFNLWQRCMLYIRTERATRATRERERERDQGDVKRCATLGSSWVSSSRKRRRRSRQNGLQSLIVIDTGLCVLFSLFSVVILQLWLATVNGGNGGASSASCSADLQLMMGSCCSSAAVRLSLT